jgi:hypothetical protein
MFKNTAISQRSVLIVLGVIVSCLAVIVAGAWSPNAHPLQGNNLAVVNKTQALQVISATVVNNRLSLQLKNISGKSINGYTISLDEGTIVTDYTISDHAIAPGEIEEKSIPLDDSPSPPQQRVSIDAAAFTDNSSEGDFNATQYIKNRRRGVKLQLQRVLPLLRNMLSVADADVTAKLKEVKKQILAFPEDSTDMTSKAINDGLRDAKQDVLLLIERLEQKQGKGQTNNGEEIRKELSKKVGEHEKRLPKL